MGLAAPDIAIPDPQQAHQHGDIVLQGRVLEMPVHVMAAAQEALEAVGADQNGQRQADGGPDRIAPAHPVPHGEDAVGPDAEFRHKIESSRHRREMIAHRVLSERPRHHGPGGAGVGHGLLGGEGFRADDEERAGWIKVHHAVGEVRAIHIGDEMHAQARLAEGAQRPRRHGGAKVRAADTDVHHIGEGLARRAAYGALPHGFREGEDPRPLGQNLRRHIHPIGVHGRVGEIPQGHVQGRPAFRVIDGIPGEEALAGVLDPCRAGKGQQMGEGGVIGPVLGIIEEEIVEFDMIAREAGRVRSEEIRDAMLADLDPVRLQRGHGRGDSLRHGTPQTNNPESIPRK